MPEHFTALVKREGEQNFVPLAEGEPLYYGDTVCLHMADDLKYGTASDRRRIALKGILTYTVNAVIFVPRMEVGDFTAEERINETFTNTGNMEGRELVLTLNDPMCFLAATGTPTEDFPCRIKLLCYYRAFCDKYLGGTETCESLTEEMYFPFSFGPYSRDFTAELTVKNVWDPVNKQLKVGPYTVEECVENGYEAVFNGNTLLHPNDGVVETAYRVTVKNIAQSVTLGGQSITVDSYPGVYAKRLEINGPNMQYETAGSKYAPLEGRSGESPTYDTGWRNTVTPGDAEVILTDSPGRIHSITLPLFGTGAGRIPLHQVGELWMGNTEQITVERAAGEDVNGALLYNSADPAANTFIRISGITAALSSAVSSLILHGDARANLRVYAALRTEGMTDFSDETELEDDGDARGFHGVMGNTAMTKAYFVRIRAVDCYGQEASVVKLSSAPLTEDFPTVFKAKAKTREAEFWWPVTFCGGLKAVRLDENYPQVNLCDRYTPGLYYAAGSLNGVDTETVYETGLPAPFHKYILLTAGDGESEGLQLIFHDSYTENGASLGCELRRIYKSGNQWRSTGIWKK